MTLIDLGCSRYSRHCWKVKCCCNMVLNTNTSVVIPTGNQTSRSGTHFNILKSKNPYDWYKMYRIFDKCHSVLHAPELSVERKTSLKCSWFLPRNHFIYIMNACNSSNVPNHVPFSTSADSNGVQFLYTGVPSTATKFCHYRIIYRGILLRFNVHDL
jgi:hypothetical protein